MYFFIESGILRQMVSEEWAWMNIDLLLSEDDYFSERVID